MSYIRTDLAIEAAALRGGEEVYSRGAARVTAQTLSEKEAAESGRLPGRYVTVEWEKSAGDDDTREAVTNELKKMLPPDGPVLVAGLGNRDMTPDALGPAAASRVLATRHLSDDFAKRLGLYPLRAVSVLSPGVMGQTGIESSDMILAVVRQTSPAAVIAIDALAARNTSRLCATVQLCDAGISPGSGVGNRRAALSRETLGVPVVAVGVPTVVDAATLVFDLTGRRPEGGDMTVTLRDIDAEIDRAGELISHAVNCALQPNIEPDILRSLV